MIANLVQANFWLQLIEKAFNARESTQTHRKTISIKIGKNAMALNPDNWRLLQVSYSNIEVSDWEILKGQLQFCFTDSLGKKHVIHPQNLIAVDADRKNVILVLPKKIKYSA
jgi:hypothetical protein